MDIIKVIYKLLLVFCFVLNSQFVHAFEIETKFDQLTSSNFGVNASLADLDSIMNLVTEPQKSLTGKSFLTVNKMGFDVFGNKQSQDSWIILDILEFTKNVQRPVLDIGCGYGYISLQILSNDAIKVIANDIALEHLLNVRKIALKQGLPLKNLYLNNKKFPKNLSFDENSLSTVILHRVLHFLSPNEIEVGLSKIQKWLQPGGKVFIVVMTPQHKEFSDWFLPIYEQEWKKGNKWPGTGLKVERALPDQAYNLPEFLHVMDERPLRYALERSGFSIEKVHFLSMKHFGKTPETRDGQEAIGIVAIKK